MGSKLSGRQALSTFRNNVIANFGGGAWSALMGVLFVPVYIHFMGVEAYGLVGMFTMILGLFAVLDLGLSGTLSREMARLSVRSDCGAEIRDLVRTLEIPYWFIGLVIAVAVSLAAPFMAEHWVNADSLSSRTVTMAFLLMGVCVSFQWPVAFYTGGLMGLQRQVVLNGVTIVMSTIRGVGGIAVLWLISPTIEAFFMWQVAVSAFHVVVIASVFWNHLPPSPGRPRFRPKLLRDIWRFAAGMTAIAITATLLTQIDKVILSRMLSLTDFGYYALANVVATILYRMINPVYLAVYPRLTALVELERKDQIRALYHQASQFVSALVWPATVVMALFAQEVLFLWTRNRETAASTAPLLALLATANALHCVMHVPYALQLAYRWTRLGVCFNAVAVIVLVPSIILLTERFGAMAAAGIWLALNVAFFFVNIPLTHRKLLPGDLRRWYVGDVGRPLLAGLVVVLLGRLAFNDGWGTLTQLFALSVIGAAALLTAALASSELQACARFKMALSRWRAAGKLST